MTRVIRYLTNVAVVVVVLVVVVVVVGCGCYGCNGGGWFLSHDHRTMGR